jgi:phage-related protein
MASDCTAALTLGTLCVTVDAKKTTTFRALQQQYGDGYMARRQDGVNPVSEMWTVTTPLQSYEYTQALEDELIALGTGFFEWTAPNESTAKKWIVDPITWTWDYSTGDLASLSFTLKRWYQ